MKLRLVMNPGSRSGRGRKLWQTWETLLRSAACELECCQTTSLDHARQLAQEAHSADALIAVGGDGTINAVLDGLMQSGRPSPAMGVLYTGTSPDFCRFHGIPLEPAAAVRALLDNPRRPVDVVRITFSSPPDHAPRVAHFACGSNIGLGSAIARRANTWRRFLGDALGTGLATIRALLRLRPHPLTLTCDGEVHKLPRCNNLSILKSPFMASGLQLQLDARPDDGTLHVVAVCGQSPLGLLRLLPAFYTGHAIRHPSVHVWRAHHVTVHGPTTTEVEFDGDPHGFLPATFTLLPQQLTLLGGA